NTIVTPILPRGSSRSLRTTGTSTPGGRSLAGEVAAAAAVEAGGRGERAGAGGPPGPERDPPLKGCNWGGGKGIHSHTLAPASPLVPLPAGGGRIRPGLGRPVANYERARRSARYLRPKG